MVKKAQTRKEGLIEMKESADEMVCKVNNVKDPSHAPFSPTP